MTANWPPGGHADAPRPAGLAAGGLGALIGSPADLSLIRMQADGTLPPDDVIVEYRDRPDVWIFVGVRDFVAAWDKVMMLDRFELA